MGKRIENLEKYKRRLTKTFDGYYSLEDGTEYKTLRSVLPFVCQKHGNYSSIATNVLTSPVGNCKGCMRDREFSSFLQKTETVHGDRYLYNKTVYVTSRKKITVTCKVHGDFQQLPSAHLQGQNCPECGQEDRIETVTFSNQEFIKKSQEKFPDKFTYELCDYKGAGSPVTLTCRLHYHFKVSVAANHLAGQGCPTCSTTKSNTTEFIGKCEKKFGDRFDYSLVDYKHYKSVIDIKCRLHSEVFKTTPNKFLHKGPGCKVCAYARIGRWSIQQVLDKGSEDQPADVYVLKLDSEEKGLFYKIGMTSDLKTRLTSLKKEIGEHAEVSLYFSKATDYVTALRLEKLSHLWLNSYRFKAPFYFGGYTECFDCPIESIHRLQKLINNHQIFQKDLEIIVKDPKELPRWFKERI